LNIWTDLPSSQRVVALYVAPPSSADPTDVLMGLLCVTARDTVKRGHEYFGHARCNAILEAIRAVKEPRA
jgi:hypothetical protein